MGEVFGIHKRVLEYSILTLGVTAPNKSDKSLAGFVIHA